MNKEKILKLEEMEPDTDIILNPAKQENYSNNNELEMELIVNQHTQKDQSKKFQRFTYILSL